MTQDRIKEVKAVYSAKNRLKHTKITGIADSKYISKPFFSGLIEKLDEKSRRNQ